MISDLIFVIFTLFLQNEIFLLLQAVSQKVGPVESCLRASCLDMNPKRISKRVNLREMKILGARGKKTVV